MPAVRAVHEAEGLWIADEVQPGFGRLGSTWWGFRRHGIEPDLVVLGKPMGNEIPIGALVGRADVMAKFGRDIRYVNTFGVNPVSIAPATAVLDVIEEEALLDNVQRSGQRLLEGLREIAGRHDGVGGVRGRGLVLASLDLSTQLGGGHSSSAEVAPAGFTRWGGQCVDTGGDVVANESRTFDAVYSA